MTLINEKIGNIVTLKRGYDLPKSKRKLGRVPIISSSGVSDYHNVAKKKGPGVVTGRYGTLGEVYYSENEFWPLNTTLYASDFKGNDSKFIYYFLKTLKLERFNGAAAVPGLDRNVIHRITVKYESDLTTQKKIASILSAYDDLIENNNQRIQLLEEMAEEIYKEWFVRFRFPGYEQTKFYDKAGKEVEHGTKGALPEGWSIKKLRDCIELYIGGGWGEESPKGKNTEPAHVLRGTDIPDFNKGSLNFDVKRYHTKSNLSSRLCVEDDIIFEVSGGTEDQSLGRTSFVTSNVLERFDAPLMCASFCKLLRINKSVIDPKYILCLLKRMYSTKELKVYQVQSTGISNYQFEDFIDATKINIPNSNIQDKFNQIVSPMLNEIQNLGAKSQLLKETRDLLLPRLISGKLSVDNIPEPNEMTV